MGGASDRAGHEAPAPAPPPEEPGWQRGHSPGHNLASPLMLYGFLNWAPATINVVNAEITSIFWRREVI